MNCIQISITLGWPKWPKCLGTAGTSGFPMSFAKIFKKMHRNPLKVVRLYCPQPSPLRPIFTLWISGKNDFFCSTSILPPLMAFKTPTNIQKHLGILKCTTQGPESIIFGHLDQFLARTTAVYNPRNGSKN